MAMEEEVGFKLLCHVDKVGSLIEKGGNSEYNASRGVDLDALLDISTDEIVKLFLARKENDGRRKEENRGVVAQSEERNEVSET
ncbi:hypothetical protein ACFX1T_022588 [Malus domestica]